MNQKLDRLFARKRLDDLVDDLYLAEEEAKLVGSRLKERNSLGRQTKFNYLKIETEI